MDTGNMKMWNREGRTRARLSSRALAAGAGLVLLAACGRGDAAPEDTGPTVVRLTPQDVAVAKVEEITSGPLISGTLTAENEAQVRAEAGGTVMGVYAEPGQSVRKGQLLARIEGSAAQQALISAQQGVKSAEASYDVARRQAERTAALVEAGAVAQQQLETARSQATAAQAQLAGARAQLAAAQKQVQNTEVRSPIAGVVATRPVNAGDVVQPGAALFTVVDPGGMKLEASISSDQLGQVHVGAPVAFTVTGYPGRTFSGKVTRISPAADPTTRQIPITVALPNSSGSLVSGLFAQGRVASEAQRAVVVPQAAVDQTGPTPTVYRVKGGKVEQVQVQLGTTDTESQRVAISAGLSAGDTLLASSSQGVQPGTPVQVTGAVAQQ
jgi:RND family efflux transporter MFP subunit